MRAPSSYKNILLGKNLKRRFLEFILNVQLNFVVMESGNISFYLECLFNNNQTEIRFFSFL